MLAGLYGGSMFSPGMGLETPSVPSFGSQALGRLGAQPQQTNPMMGGMLQAETMLQGCLCQMMEMLMRLMMGGGAATAPGTVGGALDAAGDIAGNSGQKNYGGGAPYTGGGQATGGSSAPSISGSSAPAASAADFQGGTDLGRKIAADAQSQASSMNSHGWCLRGVRLALEKEGIQIGGASAYMAADQLANNPKFKEVKVSSSELKSLPPGAIVVWNKSGAHPHGHISVALGNGKEASDHVGTQITNLGSGESFRVFMPK